MKIKINKSTHADSILSLVFVCMALIIPPLFIHLNFYPWKDEEYELMLMADYRANPLTGLTMYFGHLWSKHIGSDTFFSFRLLAYIVNTLCVVCSSIYFYRVTRNKLLSAWIFLILQLAQSLYAWYSYEWDTMSNSILAVCCVITYSFFHRPTTLKIILIGIICSLGIFARVPNIAVLVVMFCLIAVMKIGLREKFIYGGTFCVSLFLSSLAICILIWGSIGGFIASCIPDNIITGHESILKLTIDGVLGVAVMVSVSVLSWIGLLAIFVISGHLVKSDAQRKLSYFIFTLVGLSMLLLIRATTYLDHNFYIELFYVCLVLAPLFAYIKNEDVHEPLVSSLILLGFVLSMVAGSDVALHKLPCTPLFALVVLSFMKLRCKTVLRFLMIVSICLFVTYPILRLKDPHTKDWINCYTTDFGRIEKLKGIKSSEDYASYVKSVYNWAEEVEARGEKILFIGPKRYFFDYILNHTTDRVDRYPVQRYHDDTEYQCLEQTLVDEIINRFDFVHLSYMPTDEEYALIKADFEKRGFYITDKKPRSIILQRRQ
ncbi:MAG: hypothetical protein J1F05_03580 [Muribaculaceae bacterium]|nr:hypothetical protein [Muribaculaceae bacterium]